MNTSREGFSCGEIAAVFGYTSETAASKGLNPALTKIAMLATLDLPNLLRDLADRIERLPNCDIAAARKRLAEYRDQEIELQVRRLEGRADREEILAPRRADNLRATRKPANVQQVTTQIP